MVDGLGAAIVELTALSGSRTGPPSVQAAVLGELAVLDGFRTGRRARLGRRRRAGRAERLQDRAVVVGPAIVLGELAVVDRHQDQPPSTSWLRSACTWRPVA